MEEVLEQPSNEKQLAESDSRPLEDTREQLQDLTLDDDPSLESGTSMKSETITNTGELQGKQNINNNKDGDNDNDDNSVASMTEDRLLAELKVSESKRKQLEEETSRLEMENIILSESARDFHHFNMDDLDSNNSNDNNNNNSNNDNDNEMQEASDSCSIAKQKKHDNSQKQHEDNDDDDDDNNDDHNHHSARSSINIDISDESTKILSTKLQLSEAKRTKLEDENNKLEVDNIMLSERIEEHELKIAQLEKQLQNQAQTPNLKTSALTMSEKNTTMEEKKSELEMNTNNDTNDDNDDDDDDDDDALPWMEDVKKEEVEDNTAEDEVVTEKEKEVTVEKANETISEPAMTDDSNSKVSILETENKTLLEQNERLKLEIDVLRRTMEKAPSEQIEKLTANIQDLKVTIVQEREQADAECTKFQEEAKVMMDEIKALKAENRKLSGEENASRSSVVDMKSLTSKTQSNNTVTKALDLFNTLHDLQSRAKELEDENSALKESEKSLKVQNTKILKSLVAADTKLRELKSLAEEREKRMKSEIESRRISTDSLFEDLGAAKKEINSLREEIDQLKRAASIASKNDNHSKTASQPSLLDTSVEKEVASEYSEQAGFLKSVMDKKKKEKEQEITNSEHNSEGRWGIRKLFHQRSVSSSAVVPPDEAGTTGALKAEVAALQSKLVKLQTFCNEESYKNKKIIDELKFSNEAITLKNVAITKQLESMT